MGKYLEAAKKVKQIFQKAAQSLDDVDALQIQCIYPTWAELAEEGSVTAAAGYKFVHDGKLYKCVNANPTFQADWVPGVGTESLYTRIDETHAGTLEDPIQYDGNMALVSGLYYSQDGVIYKCIMDTGNPVYHALSVLVGLYVEVAE